MKTALCILAWAMACAAAGSCRYLEFQAPGEKHGGLEKAGEGRELPLYMAYPESLGTLAVRAFLQAPRDTAAAMLRKSDWQIKALSLPERNALKALRDLMEGRAREAGEAIAAALPQSQGGLKSMLRVDRGLILYLAGFAPDAEKEWQSVLRSGTDCDEIAWRNLYSLYLGRQDFAKAHGLVDEILKGDPKNKWANAAKGYLLRMLMAGGEWEDFLKEKSSWKDSLFEIQIAYGKFLKERGQLDEARKYYNRGLEGAPKNGPAWLELADIQYQLGYYIFAETCLRNAFAAGINDAYVFELYGKVLTALSTYAASGTAMRALGYTWDSAWAARCWLMAERILEDGFPHDLGSRSMAQLLYHLYCHNGKVDAAENLRNGFWFHFTGPAMPKHLPIGDQGFAPQAYLRIRVSYVGYPLIAGAQSTDFYEPF